MKRLLPGDRILVVIQFATVVVVTAAIAIIAVVALTGVGSGVTEADRYSSAAAENDRVAIISVGLKSRWDAEDRAQGHDGGAYALSPSFVLDADTALKSMHDAAVHSHSLVKARETLALVGAVNDTQTALSDATTATSEDVFHALGARLDWVSLLAVQTGDRFRALAQADRAELSHSAGLARNAVVAAVLLGCTAIVGTTLLVVLRLGLTVRTMSRERAALKTSNRALERKNEQFQALYQVVTEITETLSLRYVVRTAVTQARQLVGADLVTLRVLRDGALAVAGTTEESGDESEQRPLELGTGVAGRAAKRGKAVVARSAAAAARAPGEGLADGESVIALPLIVGARVVGSLECWSRHPDRFSADDERALEMMASQIATAVVAADTHEATERDAHHDALTGLPNRRRLDRDIAECFGPALDGGDALAVVMVDVDHFKRFNDEFGHRVGDITLQRVAEVIRSTIREQDRAYRYGGEEFTIVLQESSADLVGRVLERVRQAVERMPLTGEELQPVGPVTISMGVSFGPANSTQMGALIQQADAALYQAKFAGRNRVVSYAPHLAELSTAA